MKSSWRLFLLLYNICYYIDTLAAIFTILLLYCFMCCRLCLFCIPVSMSCVSCYYLVLVATIWYPGITCYYVGTMCYYSTRLCITCYCLLLFKCMCYELVLIGAHWYVVLLIVSWYWLLLFDSMCYTLLLRGTIWLASWLTGKLGRQPMLMVDATRAIRRSLRARQKRSKWRAGM